MTTWAGFAQAAPDFAEAGRRLLVGSDGVAIGFLATASDSSSPHLSPVCPIFCAGELYLSATAASPKVADLASGGHWVLHAFLGEGDEEFQVAGRAVAVADESERAAVHAAIPFPAYEAADPIFRLDVERSLWVYWERVGQPDTKAVRRRWSEG